VGAYGKRRVRGGGALCGIADCGVGVAGVFADYADVSEQGLKACPGCHVAWAQA